jgi:uncharacterized protein DUF5317
MLMVFIVILVSALALLRGGSLGHFVDLRLRWGLLAAAGLVVQLLIFTPFLETPLIVGLTAPLYILSMALLIGWVAANWRIPGMGIMAAGLLMNAAAIVANGGHMPVSPEQARYAGTIGRYATDGLAVSNNSVVAADGVRLWLLTDILALPAGFPFANVYSIGDLLLTVGACVLCWRTIRRLPTEKPALDEQIES